jgi:DNA ligase (NAD+)
MPTHCPLCGTEIVKPEGEAMHRCPNPACESRGLETLINWVQGPADIEGVGEETIRRLWAAGLVRSLPELYRLTKEQLLELDGFAEISATNAVAAIQESAQQVPFWRVLLGLNIPDVGWVTARSLGAHFGSAAALATATQEDVQQVDGIGPERAEAIVEWFADDQNQQLIADLGEVGLRLEAAAEERPKEGPLKGKTYVITGTLESMSREQAGAALEELGAKITGSVSAKTTALIAGEEPGNSKLTKAQKVGTEILDEAAFLELLRS